MEAQTHAIATSSGEQIARKEKQVKKVAWHAHTKNPSPKGSDQKLTFALKREEE